MRGKAMKRKKNIANYLNKEAPSKKVSQGILMYIAKNCIRLHDVDVAGRLYFPRQFRLVHEALEDFMESEERPFRQLLEEGNYFYVVARCESNYYAPLMVGDRVEVHLYTETIGSTSFTLCYHIFKEGTMTGDAKTVMVSLDRKTGKKVTNPQELKNILRKHLIDR